MEKLTHLQVYWHDKPSGPIPTTILVASANFTNPTIGFGSIIVIDDALTEGPELDSELIGRAQGSYVLGSLGQPAAVIMSMTFAFTAGEYNGSTISIAGRNTVLSAVREMSITGGTGVFRFARGYVQMRTHFFNFTSGDASVKYDIYALHY
ncbi:hypothetical protein MKW92_028531 [Papaver armeniacum]|nr:hypothetical protein MKW92_028531 [Papaver armeniacum]